MTTPYGYLIEKYGEASARGYDVRHVEAYMRAAHSTLDGLSPREFADEVEIAMACVEEGGAALGVRIAKSFGF